MNENCIDCGWHGEWEDLREDENKIKCQCPDCGSELIYSDEDWEDS